MKPPVHIGDIVLENAAGTRVNVVATREVNLLKTVTGADSGYYHRNLEYGLLVGI